MRVILVDSSKHCLVQKKTNLHLEFFKQLDAEIFIINTADCKYFDFKDNDFVFVFTYKSLPHVNALVSPHVMVKHIRINLLMYARGTSILYKQKDYVNYYDEVSLYNSKLYHKIFILTYTENLALKMSKFFIGNSYVDRDKVKFCYIGAPLPNIVFKPNPVSKSILVLDKANGFKNSDFIKYALSKLTGEWDITFISTNLTKQSYVEDGIKYHFYPNLEYKNFIKLLRKTEFFITGSLSDTLNYSVLEAFLSGCKVLAPKVNPFDEYFVDSNYTLYPPFDEHILREYIYINHLFYNAVNTKLKDSIFDKDEILYRLMKILRRYDETERV